jgi:uncharacterized protein (DUF1330 family)
MPAYLIVEHTITDPAKFQEYGDKVRPLIAKYGGRSLARGRRRVLARDKTLAAGSGDYLRVSRYGDLEHLV